MTNDSRKKLINAFNLDFEWIENEIILESNMENKFARN